MNFEDYESLPTNSISTNMTAGAIAGIMEHCVMYPMDSVKTRMQSLVPTNGSYYYSIREVWSQMIRKEGVLRPMRGMGAVVLGAGPAHAMYFSSYECLRDGIARHSVLNTTLSSGLAGCVSTLLHDGIMTPTDVIKQRLQMVNSPYRTVMDCIRNIYRQEGARAFYLSYTTQLAMNIPFQSLHFMTYEFCQSITNSERCYNPTAHVISGAVAGGIAAALTTPLDVCKTLLNTQQGQVRVSGLIEAIETVYRLGGPFAYFRGLKARVLYQIPSAAICWSTYEFFKYLLNSTPSKTFVALAEFPTNAGDDESSSDEQPVPSSIHKFAHSETAPAPRSLSSIPSSKPCELPMAASHHGVYNTFTISRIHSTDISTRSG